MKTKGFLIIVLFLILAGPAAGLAVRVGEESPQFVIKTIDGPAVNSKNIKGKKPLFLVFWATWCPVCKKEIPKLEKINSTFGPKGMDFLAIDVGINDSLRKVKRYIMKYKISYPVAFDEGSRITKRFNVQGTPTIIIVDKRGIVRYRSAAVPDDLAEHFDRLVR